MSVVSDVIISVSSVAVAFFAYSGVKSWKKELAGKAAFEVAKQMMKSAYKVLDAYKWTTSQGTFSTEFPPRVAPASEPKQIKNVMDNWYIKSGRFNILLRSYNELYETNIEIRSLLGPELSEDIDKIVYRLKIEVLEVMSGIEEYFSISRDEDLNNTPTADPVYKEMMKNIVFQNPESELNHKIKTFVGELDKELTTHLRERKRWW